MLHLNEAAVFARYRFRQPGPFIDVGANYGAFFAAFARRGVEVVAFEPHPELFAFLQRKYQHQHHVKIVQRAISDTPGVLPFYTSAEHPGIHSLAAFHPTHQATVEVEVSSLDLELSRVGVQAIAALKIDTEGADLLALKGCDFAERRPELVMVEFMDARSREYFGYTHHDMAALMGRNGYETWVSEWSSIEEYGRADEPADHRWLGFSAYRRDGDPAWGNLIFVRPEDRSRLRDAVGTTLRRARARQLAQAVPGSRVAAAMTRWGLEFAYAKGIRRTR